MSLIGNVWFKGTPGLLKHCSGLPMVNPGGPLKLLYRLHQKKYTLVTKPSTQIYLLKIIYEVKNTVKTTESFVHTTLVNFTLQIMSAGQQKCILSFSGDCIAELYDLHHLISIALNYR